MRKLFLLAQILMLGIFAISASYAAEEKMKVAFVEVTTAAGSGWVTANKLGTEYLQSQLPSVDVKFIESIEEGPGVVSVLKNLANQGYKVIFADAYGYATFLSKVADQYPDTVFVNQQAVPESRPNVASYYGYLEEARYLQGVVAGLMTKTNRIGFVGAYPFSPVIAGVNAFALGVQSVNPSAIVKVTWVNSWNDPPKEKEAADALITDGADVIANHSDSAATLKAAAARGKWGMSANADWSAAAPDAFLTANVWHWGVYYTNLVKSVMDGKFKPERFMGDLKNGVVDIAPLGPKVPDSVRQAVMAAKADVISGKRTIFAGPLSDNSGKLRVAEGDVLPLSKASSTMDWLVKGVEGATK